MIDKLYIELMNKKIDGTILPDEDQMLNKYLKKNKEAQQYLSDLQKTADLLGEIPEIEPPEEIKFNILNSIDKSLYKNRKENVISFIETIKRFLSPAPQLAYGLIMGVFLSFFAYIIFFSNQMDEIKHEDISGTMLTENLETARQIDLVKVDSERIKGLVDLKISENFLWVNISNESENKYSLEIEYDSSEMKFNNIFSHDSGEFIFKNTPGVFKVTLPGNNKLTATFTLLNSEITHLWLVARKNGSEIMRKKIEVME